MEEKIVEDKKEGSSFSWSLSLSYLSHLSHLSIYLVCLRSTTPLWFTDKDISALSCDCKSHTLIANGRHFRLCKLNSKTLFHNNMRDELFLMCRSAGVPTIKEPENLLPDEPLQRPGDIYFPCWSTNSSTLTKHAIDFTAPSVDARWDTIPIVQQLLRSSISGSTASASVTRKLTNKGSRTERVTISAWQLAAIDKA
jgi:hypothetical protein